MNLQDDNIEWTNVIAFTEEVKGKLFYYIMSFHNKLNVF